MHDEFYLNLLNDKSNTLNNNNMHKRKNEYYKKTLLVIILIGLNLGVKAQAIVPGNIQAIVPGNVPGNIQTIVPRTKNQKKSGAPYYQWSLQGSVHIGDRMVWPPNYKERLTVDGKIHAKDIKVSRAAGQGADFVFDDEYDLPTLKFVEKFIQKNKHLPEIASEKEMEENGLLLGEMNIKLLQKIEELTLYTIQQQKEINKQKEKEEKQSMKIESLKDRFEKLSTEFEKITNKRKTASK